jgi:acyl-CoA synthetase (AMP-forming)/AMP-acid ligase II
MTTAVAELTNIASHLARVAQSQPESLAVAVANADGSYTRLTCAELDALCDRAAHALRGLGVTKGTRTVLMVKPSVEFFAITFALFRLGAIPVMVDPGMGTKNLGICLAEARPTAFIGVPKAQIARRLFGWAKQTLQTSVVVGTRMFPADHSFAKAMKRVSDTSALPVAFPEPGETAAILFTSGSTGVPKGVVYTHETFQAQVRLLREVYGIEPGEVDLSTFPLFALFGPALGMASVVPLMDASRPASANPRDLARAIDDFSCTNVFASPALVRLLGLHCEATGTRLQSVKRVLSAGAPATPASLELLGRFLPDGVEIFTPYGATEALPVSSIGSNSILAETREQTEAGRGVCVGHPLPGVDIAIIPIDDRPIENFTAALPLPTLEIGEITVRGDVVTESYFNRPESTALAKIRDGDRVWHRMGDVGYLDDRGRLWMCGRKSHRVETGEETLFTIPCEAIFNLHPSVHRTALVGLGPRGSQRPVLCVELLPGIGPTESLCRELADAGQKNDLTRSISTILFHKRFPVDVRHNAKIFRERLAEWAAGQLP